MLIKRRRHKVWLALCFGLFAALAAFILSLMIVDVRHAFSGSVLAFGVTGLAGLAVLACVPWWKKLDEMERSTHLFGWYWGGTLGAWVGLIGLIAIYGGQSSAVHGAVMVLIAQVVAYSLFWVGIRAARRSPDV